MRLNPEGLLDLEEQIEAQGGMRSTAECRGRKYRMKIEDKDGTERYKEYFTQGCSREIIFVVPFGDDKNIRACAICDRMDLWPRFGL